MQIAFSTSIHTLLDLHDDVFLWPSLSGRMHVLFSADETRWPPEADGRSFGTSSRSHSASRMFLVLSQQGFFTVMQRKQLHLRHCECGTLKCFHAARESVPVQAQTRDVHHTATAALQSPLFTSAREQPADDSLNWAKSTTHRFMMLR